MYFVYILKRNDNRKTYIGYTSDLRRRLREHGNKNPEIIYYEAYKSEKDARKREQILKQRGQTVRRLKERIGNSLK
ncbi:MAG: GIY-YIG nuclease family protein [Candidatus Yanofskybacteria bacterium]|nr:GIY-YIG nuclease family protein [Candidatus Yanofskybacteria bacterium]